MSLALCLPGVDTAQILGPPPPERGILISTWQEEQRAWNSLWMQRKAKGLKVRRASLGVLGSVFSFVHVYGVRLSWNISFESESNFVPGRYSVSVSWHEGLQLCVLLGSGLGVTNPSGLAPTASISGDGTRMCPRGLFSWLLGCGRAGIWSQMLLSIPYHPIPGHSHSVGIELELLAKKRGCDPLENSLLL